MKRFSIILLVVLFVWSCNRSQNSQATSGDEQKQDQNQERNAKNEVRYHGRYLGILPCDDCHGIQTEILLKKDGTYVKKTKHLDKGKDKTFEVTGKFSWNSTGEIIILEGITGSPNAYYVTEGAITQLDMDGIAVEGEPRDNYRLKKTF